MQHDAASHLRHGCVVLFSGEKVDVSLGDQAHQLIAHPSVHRDRDAGETIVTLGLYDIGHGVLRGHHDRIQDEALLVFLQEK